MKKIQFYSLLFISLMMMTIGLIACTNDEAVVSDENKETTNFAGKTSDEGYSYALNFYKTSITLGESVDLIDPDTKQGVTITEIKVNNEARARGYVVKKVKTDVVKQVKTDPFLLFADVNREKDVLTVYDANTGKQEIFSNLPYSEDYKNTEKFDFIKYTNQQVTAAKGCGFWKRMWGRCEWHKTEPIPGSPGYCIDTILIIEYRLGFELPPRKGGGTGGWAPNSGAYPCQ